MQKIIYFVPLSISGTELVQKLENQGSGHSELFDIS